MENQHVINMLGITNQQVYNNRRDINNLMELWTSIRDQLSGSSGRTPVYNPMIATLNGGGFSITNIQDLVANGAGTFGGTLTVSGATALGGSLTVTGITSLNNNLNVTGITTINVPNISNGPGGGGHRVIGGASVTLDFYIGQDLNVAGNSILTGTLDVSGITNINNNTPSAYSTNGALVVTGGVGIGQNLNVGGSAEVTGTLIVSNATTLQSNLDVSGIVSALNTGDITLTPAPGTSSSTSVQISGGLQVLKNVYIDNSLYINQNASITGDLTVDNNTILGSATTDTLTVNAISTFNGDADFYERVRIYKGTQSNSTGTGALIVSGGVGIAKRLQVGQQLHASSIADASSGQPSLKVSGGIKVEKSVIIDETLTVNGNTTLAALTATSAQFSSAITQTTTQFATLGLLTSETLTVNGLSSLTTLSVSGATTCAGLTAGATTCASLNVIGASSLAATNVSGQLRITDNTNISFTFAADTAPAGAVIVDGGVGIKKDLLVEGYIFANGHLEPHAIRAGGQIAVQYDMGITAYALSTHLGLELYNENGNNVIGKEAMIAFYNQANSSKTSRGAISAGAQAIGNDCSGYLGFYTNTSTINTLTERMRLTSEGYLAIGTNIINSSAYHLDINSGSENICARFASTDTAVRVLFTDSIGTSYIEARNDFRFGNNSREFMRINNVGNVSINTTDSTYRLQINTDSTVSNDGIRLLVGKAGDGLIIKKSSTTVAFIGEANTTPSNGGQLSLFNTSGTEDIRLMNAGAVTTEERYNWIRTASSKSKLIIGEFTAAPSSVPSNEYSGVTITGNNPSLALTASSVSASAWTWLQYINSSGTTTFSSGVNQTQPQYIIKAGIGMDSPYAIGVNTSQLVTIAATGGSGNYYGQVTIQSADGTFTTDSNDNNYGRVALTLSHETDVTDQVGSAILWTKNAGRKVAAISNYFYGDVDQSGLAFFVQQTSSGSSGVLKEAMRIDNSGNVFIGTTRWSVAEDTSYVVNIARGQGGSGNLVLQGDNYSSGNPRLAFKNELTSGGTTIEANMSLNSSGQFHFNTGGTNVVAQFESTDADAGVEFKDTTGIATLKCRNDFRFSNVARAGVAGSGGELARLDESGDLNIGTTGAATGNHKLVIKKASTVDTVNSHISLIGSGATIGNGPQILFSESGNDQAYVGGTIGFKRTGTNSKGDLIFSTRTATGDATTLATEIMRITNLQTVNINSDITPTFAYGQSQPSTLLLAGTTNYTAPLFTLLNVDTTVNADDIAGTIQWCHKDDASSGYCIAKIQAYAAGGAGTGNSGGGYLSFSTNRGGTGVSPQEVMRISKDGDCTIGSLASEAKLSVSAGTGSGPHKHATFSGTANRGLAIRTDDNGQQQNGIAILDAQDTETNGAQLHLRCANNTVAAFSTSSSSGAAIVVYGTNSTGGTVNWIPKSIKGTTESHCHYGSYGDWYIRPANTSSGSVYITNRIDVSDQRLKDNITDITYGLQDILQLQPRHFNWKDSDKEQTGFIAQEVESIIPSMVKTGELKINENDTEGIKAVDYNGLVAVLVKTVQQLNGKISTLEARLLAAGL